MSTADAQDESASDAKVPETTELETARDSSTTEGKGLAMTAYGAIMGLDPNEPNDPLDWEFRGTLVGILADVATNSLTMVMTVGGLVAVEAWHRLRKMDHSEDSHGFQLRDDAGPLKIAFVRYTEGYVLSVPILASAIVVFIIGRDLLQKRLYYNCLKRGAVVSYGTNKAYLDWLTVLYFVGVVHCWWYAFLVCGSLVRTLNSGKAGKQELDEAKSELGHLASHLIGVTILAVLFYSKYDIEATLVPLSQYVHDAEAAEGSAKESLTNIDVLPDTKAKAIVKNHSELNSMTAEALEKCEAMIKIFHEEKSCSPHNYLDDQEDAIYLVGSLWPAWMLARSDTTGQANIYFRMVWYCHAFFGALWLVVCAYLLSLPIARDLQFVIKGREKVLLLHMLVCALHLVVVGICFEGLLETMPLCHAFVSKKREPRKDK